MFQQTGEKWEHVCIIQVVVELFTQISERCTVLVVGLISNFHKSHEFSR